MEKIVQSGIVVVSPQNNPAIITPQFLMEYEITPENWEVILNIESLQRSAINFKNGYTILSESGKIVFQYDLNDDGPDSFAEECKISEIAINYLNQISKVKYISVGINYVFITDAYRDKNGFEKLLIPKIREMGDIVPQQLKFQKPFSDNAVQNLSIISREYKHNEDVFSCLEFNGNLHFNILETSIEESWKKTVGIIDAWTSYFDPFSEMVEKIKGALDA